MTEDSKTYVFDSAKNTIDPNMLLAMMNNNGGIGGNGSWLWVIFLFFLFGWRGNGYGGFGGNDSTNVDLLMQAINGNGNAIGQLSTKLNCDVNSINSAINAVQSSIQSVGNQVGLSGQQVINSIQSGNAAIASQLAQCCCDNKLAICQQTNALTSRIDQLANGVTQGFSATAYETAQQTCGLQNTMRDNTAAIIAKLDSIEDSRKDREITALHNQLSNEHQTAAFAAMLAPIQTELNAIKCAQPATVTVPQNNGVLVPSCVAYQMGLYNSPFSFNGGNIWS